MTNYRIRKETYGDNSRYYPQMKFLGIWWDMFGWNRYYDGFSSYNNAEKELCDCIRGTKQEYFDVNCGELK